MNRKLICLLACMAAIVLIPAVAQDPGPGYRPGPEQQQSPGPDPNQAGQQPPQGDPSLGAENDPTHGVARISLLNGDVSVRRGDSGDVVAAAMNAPLVSQDRILTSSSSRAEVQFDSANLLRVGSNSEVRLNDVEYTRFQIQVAIGTLTFRVRRNSHSEVEIDTPSISFRPLGPGSYRVMVREDGSSEITVREGQAEIFGPRGTERVRPGTTVLARGSANDPEFQMAAAIGPDDWDRWNEQRDRQLETESARTSQYVSPEITGTEDLEGYGQWANDPGYGEVWVPRVEPGWAPYRAGRWVWEDFYGWTWVSSDPWGWAPYHYGRWYCGSLGWAWYPGPRFGHHYWSPALVGFFGFGGFGGFRAGVGFGFGNVGWVPLAPFEAFHPWWGRGLYGGFAGRSGFINNTRIINNTNLASVYRNARVNNGVTAVASNDFGRRGGQFMGMNGSSIRDAGMVHGVLPVTPDRSSLRMSDRAVQSGAFPQRNVSFAGRTSGAAVGGARVPFDQQQRAMDQVARRTFSGSAGSAMGAQNTNGPGGRSSGGVNTNTGTHGWSHFGEPIHGAVADSPRQGAASQSYSNGAGRSGAYSNSTNSGASNWHRFGEPGQSYSAPQSGGRQQSTYESGAGRSYQQTAPRSTYQSAPQYSAPRSDAGRSYNGGQAVRISPPMVHERSSAPNYSGGGGGSRSAPSYSGGGGGRSGGGGGGSHSSGGGGGHSSSSSGGHGSHR